MKVEITSIEVSKCYPLRHEMLRRGKPLETCYFDGDNSEGRFHLGAIIDKEIIGIISVYEKDLTQFKNSKGAQFRGIAVASKHQRKGVASKLINCAEKETKKRMNPKYIWLNGRISANKLYLGRGFDLIGDPFEINTIGIHQRFIKMISYDN